MDRVRRHARVVLTALAASAWLPACAASAPQPVVQVVTPHPPLLLEPAEHLAPAAGLEWIVIVEPQPLLASRALQPELARLFPDFRLDLLERSTAIDLRKLRRVAIASYPGSTLFVLAGVRDPAEAERRFRARLMRDLTRTEHRDDAVLVTGRLASGEPRALVSLAPDVVVIESGGTRYAKAAWLRAMGKLERSPSALRAPGLPGLVERVGSAPMRGFAPGPFVGEWEHGLHDLLGSASAAAAAVRITPVDSLQGSFALGGEWGARAEEASGRLATSWGDLANSGFGRLTGLDRPLRDPHPTHAPDAVPVPVEVDPPRFLDGLRAAVSARIDEIMQ